MRPGRTATLLRERPDTELNSSRRSRRKSKSVRFFLKKLFVICFSRAIAKLVGARRREPFFLYLISAPSPPPSCTALLSPFAVSHTRQSWFVRESVILPLHEHTLTHSSIQVAFLLLKKLACRDSQSRFGAKRRRPRDQDSLTF